jgi:parallel beta-helix repeat protein
MMSEITIIRILMIILLIHQIHLPFGYAQPSLLSSDNGKWSENVENGYMVYTREIVQSRNIPIYVDIVNLSGKYLTFGWRQKANYPGIFGNMIFTTNGTSVKTNENNQEDFEDLGPYPIDNRTNYRFELFFKKGGKVWIRFPLQDNIVPPVERSVQAKQLPLQEPTIFFVDSDAKFLEAMSNSSESKLIYLKQDFEFNGPLYINKSNIKIVSANNNTMKPIFNGNGNEYVIAIEDSSNVAIDGLMITNSNVGILLEDDVNCSIKNCTIKNFYLDGISLNNSSGAFIKDNKIVSHIQNNCNLTGINLTRCENNCELANNTIDLLRKPDNPLPIALLVDRSQNNFLSIKPQREGYLIFEDGIDWQITCDGSFPCCKRSVDDPCDCSAFIAISENDWDLCGNE